ncbi:glycosyltransferase family 39 protein [Bacillota bacterium LX-D]|nr:glycosyltransferase family 39 protein [Bacillota bacterium LX-D]
MKKSLLLILGVAFVLRILWILNVPTAPVYDFLKYHQGALSIAQGLGYKLYGLPTAFEPIGYPGFLALLYKIFGPYLIVPKVVNVFMSLGIIYLGYVLGRELFHRGVGLLAALMLALSPRNITYTSVLSTEIFFTFFLLLSLVITLKYTSAKWSGPILGILAGILALTKPFMLLFPGVIFLLLLVRKMSFLASCKKTLWVTLFVILTICPWTIRNYYVFHRFIPISTNGGITIYLNNNPYAQGHWQDPFKLPNSPLAKYQNPKTGFWDELAVDKVGKELAGKWILENPGDFIKLGLKKWYYIYNDAWDVSYSVDKLTNGKPLENRWWVYRTARQAYKFLAYSLLLYALFFCRMLFTGKGIGLRSHWPLLLPIMFFSGLYFIFEGQPRYIFPLLPMLILMSSWGIISFFRFLALKFSLKSKTS